MTGEKNSVEMIVIDQWLKKRFSEFIPMVKKSLKIDAMRNERNSKNPSENVVCQLVDTQGANLPFSLSFKPGGEYICSPPIRVSQPTRNIIRVSDLLDNSRPGETFTVRALAALVKEDSESKKRGDVLDIPGSGPESGVYFSSFIAFKELGEWRESKKRRSHGGAFDSMKNNIEENSVGLFLSEPGDSGVVRKKEMISTSLAKVEYCESTPTQAKFHIFDKKSSSLFVAKDYLRLLTKRNFIERLDMIIRKREGDNPWRSLKNVFNSLAALEEFAEKSLPIEILGKVADLSFRSGGEFFVVKDYATDCFNLGVRYFDEEKRLYKTAIAAKNPGDIKSLIGNILLSTPDSFIENVRRRNDREER